MSPAGAELAGGAAGVNLWLASLRGAPEAGTDPGEGGKGAVGLRAEGGGTGDLVAVDGGGEGSSAFVSASASSAGGVCNPLGEGGGRTMFDGRGAGGRPIGGAGGRFGDEPAAGGIGFGATNSGGGWTRPRGVEVELGAGGPAEPGGRAGGSIRTASFSGSFRSAILF